MPSLPAAELERLVVEEIAAICRDARLADPVIAEAARQQAAEVASLRTRVRDAEVLVAKLGEHPERDGDRLTQAGLQVEAARALLADAEAATISKAAARAALGQFEPVWSALVPTERAQLLRALVERIQVDGQVGKVTFVFRAGGIADLARQAGGQPTTSGEP